MICYSIYYYYSAISSIVSFIASSNVLDDKIKTYFTLGVGILATIGTFLQSMSSAMNYNGKAEAHTIANDEYDNINTNILFELQNPSESLNNTDDFYNKIKQNILDVKKKCNYIIPMHIKENIVKINLIEDLKKLNMIFLKSLGQKKLIILKTKLLILKILMIFK